ncbi:hypothetical protein TNCV_1261551 [Trichonephila clavipes]|nr:hypothetical protein TNCV_1261551 [Trichonephila clavipes]
MKVRPESMFKLNLDLEKVLRRLTKFRSRCKAVIHYREHKLLSGTDVSEKAERVLKTTNTGRPQTSRTPENIEKVSAVVRRTQSADEVKSASQAELKYMAKNGFQNDLYKPWQKCVATQGSYVEGECVSAA